MTDPSRPRWPPYLVFLAPALAALLLALASPFLPPGWARAFAAHSAESGLSLVMMFGSLTVFTLFLFAFLRASHRPRDVVACIALSTAIHFLIILFFGIWEVSRVPARPAAAEKTYRLAEGLPSVAEAEVGEEVRQQSLDLSVPDVALPPSPAPRPESKTEPVLERQRPELAEKATATPAREAPQDAAASAPKPTVQEPLASPAPTQPDLAAAKVAQARPIESSLPSRPQEPPSDRRDFEMKPREMTPLSSKEPAEPQPKPARESPRQPAPEPAQRLAALEPQRRAPAETMSPARQRPAIERLSMPADEIAREKERLLAGQGPAERPAFAQSRIAAQAPDARPNAARRELDLSSRPEPQTASMAAPAPRLADAHPAPPADTAAPTEPPSAAQALLRLVARIPPIGVQAPDASPPRPEPDSSKPLSAGAIAPAAIESDAPIRAPTPRVRSADAPSWKSMFKPARQDASPSETKTPTLRDLLAQTDSKAAASASQADMTGAMSVTPVTADAADTQPASRTPARVAVGRVASPAARDDSARESRPTAYVELASRPTDAAAASLSDSRTEPMTSQASAQQRIEGQISSRSAAIADTAPSIQPGGRAAALPSSSRDDSTARALDAAPALERADIGSGEKASAPGAESGVSDSRPTPSARSGARVDPSASAGSFVSARVEPLAGETGRDRAARDSIQPAASANAARQGSLAVATTLAQVESAAVPATTGSAEAGLETRTWASPRAGAAASPAPEAATAPARGRTLGWFSRSEGSQESSQQTLARAEIGAGSRPIRATQGVAESLSEGPLGSQHSDQALRLNQAVTPVSPSPRGGGGSGSIRTDVSAEAEVVGGRAALQETGTDVSAYRPAVRPSGAIRADGAMSMAGRPDVQAVSPTTAAVQGALRSSAATANAAARQGANMLSDGLLASSVPVTAASSEGTGERTTLPAPLALSKRQGGAQASEPALAPVQAQARGREGDSRAPLAVAETATPASAPRGRVEDVAGTAAGFATRIPGAVDLAFAAAPAQPGEASATDAAVAGLARSPSEQTISVAKAQTQDAGSEVASSGTRRGEFSLSDAPSAAPSKMEVDMSGTGAGRSRSALESPTLQGQPQAEHRALLSVGTAPVPDSVPEKAVYKMRKPEKRRQYIVELGGTPETEDAVERALIWLSHAQCDDGRWDLAQFKTLAECGGAGDLADEDAAATGLSLLAFLGAGYTHTEGQHKEVVRRGLEWLLAGQAANGDLRREGTMYGQAIGTTALCESYSLTGDQRLIDPCRRAVKFILDAQNPDEGWRYQPRDDNDTSVTGWQILALKSARIAGVSIPERHFVWTGKWLDKVRQGEQGGLYTYKPGHAVTPVMTAEGWFCQLFMGEKVRERGQNESTAYIMGYVPAWSPETRSVHLYYWYYATLSLYLSGAKEFDAWNTAMTSALLKGNIKSGPKAGSWDPVCQLGERGGRIYTTAMSALCLEVYYRFLPFYKMQDPKSSPTASPRSSVISDR